MKGLPRRHKLLQFVTLWQFFFFYLSLKSEISHLFLRQNSILNISYGRVKNIF